MRILIAKYWTELCHLTVSIEFQSDSSSVYRSKNKKKINLCFDTLIEQKRNHSLSFLTIFALHTYHPSSQCVSCYYYNWHITTSNAHFFRPWRSINSIRNRAKATWEETFQRKSRFKWNDINRIPDDLLPDKTSHSYPAPCQRPRIQRKPKVHCGGGRQLPFYQDKGSTQQGHLTRSTSSIRRKFETKFPISTQPCTMLGRRLFFSDGHSLHLSPWYDLPTDSDHCTTASRRLK